MFDNQKLGTYILHLRKKQGMTQSGLAERMGISPQAVSNWERGESMPDIALLTLLARTLGTTVDRLLAAADAAVTEQVPETPTVTEPPAAAPAEDAETSAKDSKISVAEQVRLALETALSACKDYKLPEGVQDILEEVRDSIGELEDVIEELEEDEDEDDEDNDDDDDEGNDETGHQARTGKPVHWSKIFALAPFLGEEELDKLVDRAMGTTNMGMIMGLAPFLSEETLDKLVYRIEGSVDIGLAISLAPFLSEETLDKLVDRVDKCADFNIVVSLAPFLSEKKLSELLARLVDDEE